MEDSLTINHPIKAVPSNLSGVHHPIPIPRLDKHGRDLFAEYDLPPGLLPPHHQQHLGAEAT